MNIDAPGYDTEELEDASNASGVVGNWDWNPLGKVFRYDRGAAAYLAGDPDLAGFDLDETTATSGIHPDDREWLAREVSQAMTVGGLFLAEYRVVTSQGAVRWVLCRGHLYLNDLGRFVRGRGTLIDITPHRDLEHGYVARAEAPSDDPLDTAAAHCLQARHALQMEGSGLLRAMLDQLLLELGREISRRMKKARAPR